MGGEEIGTLFDVDMAERFLKRSISHKEPGMKKTAAPDKDDKVAASANGATPTCRATAPSPSPL